MSRERVVRFKYPNAFIKLVQALDVDLDRRKIASVLQLPLSTVYRWASAPHSHGNFQPGWTQQKNDALAREIDALVRECEWCGLEEVGAHVSQLIPDVFGTPWHESKSFRKGRTYNFIGHFKNQIVIGELSFPHGANGNVEKTMDILQTGADSSSAGHQKLLLAKMEIDQHYYTRLSCESLAQIIGMNRFRFIRDFRARFGVSPYQYVNRVRVDHAKHMLALTSHSLDLIATSVGFSSASSLARAFKRFAGASPSNFLPTIAPAATPQRDIAA
jgi:AraC-like DNA-binding protein